MKILNWLSSLLPSFSKKDIFEDLRITRKEIEESKSPIKNGSDFFSHREFMDPSVRGFNNEFIKETTMSGKFTNFVSAMARLIDQIDSNLNLLDKLVEKHFADDVLKVGLTYTRANLLRYIEVLNFALRYCRHSLVWTYMLETRAADASTEITLTDGEINWLNANRKPFFAAFNILMIPKDHLEKAINSIPDAIIDPITYDGIKAVAGATRLDPLAMNFIGVKYNPFYHLREYIVEWQDTRYKVAIEERNMLEMQLLNLKTKLDGRNDAKLEQHISYTEERLQKLKTKIFKYEEEANG